MPSRRTSMVPSATEVAELAQALRDDPKSVAFARLGEVYLALGRPREAVEVLTRGLALSPENLAGRSTLAHAYAALHQWKEAQAELLIVVKADRQHGAAFQLLGEVLLRRADYARAVKALAHAQNLAPASGDIKDLLAHARDGRPLDPPAPIPTATWPESTFEGESTAVADSDIDRTLIQLEGEAFPEVAAPLPPPPVGPRPRTLDAPRGSRAELEEAPTLERKRTRKVLERHLLETSPEVPSLRRELTQEIDLDSSSESTSEETQAATREMRKDAYLARGARGDPAGSSTSSGEDYLNELLGVSPAASLLSQELSLAPPAERSSRRIFALIWAITILCFLAGGGWVYARLRARDRAVAERVAEARTRLGLGKSSDLAAADAALSAAVADDSRSAVALALLTEVRAIQLLLYGVGRIEEVDLALAAATDRLRNAHARDPGQRELAMARAAHTLLVVPTDGEAYAKADSALGDSGATDDGLALWLLGALRLAVLDRTGARRAFEKADAGGTGPVVARLFLADMALDDGDVESALASYRAVLGRSQGHSLAIVGQAMARVEGGIGLEALADELSQGLPKELGIRPLAWKRLVLGRLSVGRGELSKAKVELEMAQAALLPEPRFLGYLALVRLELGQVPEAESLRRRIRYAGETSERDPVLALVDARLLLARGLPGEAIAALGSAKTARACLVRGRALLDAGKAMEAQAQFVRGAELLPNDPVPQAYLELARVLSADPGTGEPALTKLVELALSHPLPELRFVLAEARLARAQWAEARPDLEAALDGHPYAFLAHLRLSDLYLKAGRKEEAEKALRSALLVSPMYLPARTALARLLLLLGKGPQAHAEIQLVIDAGHANSAEVLLYAEVLAKLGQKEAARQALQKARELGARPEDIGRVEAAI